HREHFVRCQVDRGDLADQAAYPQGFPVGGQVEVVRMLDAGYREFTGFLQRLHIDDGHVATALQSDVGELAVVGEAYVVRYLADGDGGDKLLLAHVDDCHRTVAGTHGHAPAAV